LTGVLAPFRSESGGLFLHRPPRAPCAKGGGGPDAWADGGARGARALWSGGGGVPLSGRPPGGGGPGAASGGADRKSTRLNSSPSRALFRSGLPGYSHRSARRAADSFSTGRPGPLAPRGEEARMHGPTAGPGAPVRSGRAAAEYPSPAARREGAALERRAAG